MDTYIPNPLMKRIFSYISYHELKDLRLVCKRYNYLVQDYLNESIIKTMDRIRRLLNNTKKSIRYGVPSQNILRYYKVLNYLRSELNLLFVTTSTYTKDKCYNFNGGLILDYYDKILCLPYDEMDSQIAYIQIYHLVENFLDHFDFVIEPEILKDHKKYASSWFGVKFINLLDCSLDLNFKVEISTSLDSFVVDGEYHGEELRILDHITNKNVSLNTNDEKLKFIQVVRNNVRWNNLLYCIERTTSELSTAFFENVSQTVMKNSSILEKLDVQQSSDTGVWYNITLKCKKHFLPLRVNSLISTNESLQQLQLSSFSKEINDSEDDPSYEFQLVMKVRSKPEEGMISEQVYKIFNTCSTDCVITAEKASEDKTTVNEVDD